MKYYRRIPACLTYQTYEFRLEKLTQQHYASIKSLVQTLGENTYPLNLGVLHIRHSFFLLDFPSYGFPVFKINFYQQTPPDQVTYYLELLDNYLTRLFQT